MFYIRLKTAFDKNKNHIVELFLVIFAGPIVFEEKFIMSLQKSKMFTLGKEIRHRVTIPCKWSFEKRTLFMHFSCASPWLYAGYCHCVNQKYELMRDHQV